MNWRRFFDFRELRDEPKPFLEHIEDLRRMLIKMLVVLGLMMAVAFAFQKRIVELIERPLLAFDPERTSLTNFGVADPLTIAIELSFYAGLVMAFPFLVLFLAEFILPALTPKERRMLYPAAAVSFGFSWPACSSPTIACCRPTLDYFFNYSKALNWRPLWSVREYFSFTTQFVVSFGLAFELPLAVLLLVKLEILSYEVLQKTRAFAVIIILFLAAIITPTTDMLTLILMAGPMYLLYEGCILIAWLMERKVRRQSLAANSTRG